MKIEPAMPLMKIPHYQPWRQSRAQSSPAQRWVGRRGDLWGHEKNMIFLIGSQKNNRWAEVGRTGNLLKKISIFIGCGL